MSPADLESALGGEAAALVELMSRASEEERRQAGPLMLRWRKAQWADALAKSVDGIERTRLWHNLPLALLGTANLGELKKAKLFQVADPQLAARVLRDRQPPWTQAWAEWMLDETPFSWSTVRALERHGLITRPAGEAYVLGWITGASREGAYALLTTDPELLTLVGRLFEVEGAGEHSLAAFDKYRREAHQWSVALIRLSEEGRLSRSLLLEASLEALNRGFATFRAGWFARFHEALKPTQTERLEHLEAVFPLLLSPISSTVSFALKILTEVARKNPLPGERLLSCLGPVWMLPSKGPVLSALRLLAQTPPGEAWLEHLTQAVTHPDPEVQRQALALLKRAGSRPPEELVSGLEPSVQREWLGSAREKSPPQPRALAPLPGPLEPCQSVEEVLRLAGRLLEEAGPPADIERLLDGVRRFNGRQSDQLATLQKRIKLRLKGQDLRRQLAALLSTWLGDPVEIAGGHFLRSRVLANEESQLLWTFQVEVSSHTSGGKTYHHRHLRVEGVAPDEMPRHTSEVDLLRWQAYCTPGYRERFQLLGIRQIANNLDWWEADWSARVYLETLLEIRQPWRRTSAFLGALGLACKEPGQRGVALEAVAQGLQAGLLEPRLLGEAMAEVASTGMVTPQRWAAAFDEMRRFVDLGGLFEALRRMLALRPENFEARPLLGPLLEIATALERPITDEGVREYLRSLGRAGKAGAQALRLLALER